jgi:hypothetical protein
MTCYDPYVSFVLGLLLQINTKIVTIRTRKFLTLRENSFKTDRNNLSGTDSLAEVT